MDIVAVRLKPVIKVDILVHDLAGLISSDGEVKRLIYLLIL